MARQKSSESLKGAFSSELKSKFDLGKIEAKLEKGLLHLEIPYISKATPKTIEIK